MTKANILVVDDTPANLELLESVLYDNGYNVRTSLSGSDALRLIKLQIPDLILLDIMMPGIDGYDTCKKIKEDEKLKDIPVVFLSAKGDSVDKIKGFDAGAVDYLSKPFDINELLVRIKTHLKLYFLQQIMEEKLEIIDEYVITSSTDLEGTIVDVSEALCKVSGYTKDELLGKNHKILRHPDMPSSTYEELWSTIKKGETWRGEIKNQTKNKGYYWVDAIISPKLDVNGNIIGYNSLRHDITDKKEIEKISITDQLTNLYNRRYFNNVFPIEIKRSIRNGTNLSFIMLDVDFFKQYNDTYGHQEGDNVLESIGTSMKQYLQRGEDYTFRLGGEEFGIICTTKEYQDAINIAEGIRKEIESLKIKHSGNKVSKFVTISLGLVFVDFSKKSNYEISTDAMYKMADDELYMAKEAGRNRLSSKAI